MHIYMHETWLFSLVNLSHVDLIIRGGPEEPGMGEDSCFLPQGPQGHVITIESIDVHVEQDPKSPSADTAV